ncbi:MAG: hypothetical protein R3Y56_00365 [Akkermansia sp.]
MKLHPTHLSILALSSTLLLCSCDEEKTAVPSQAPVSQEQQAAQYQQDLAAATDSGFSLLVADIVKKFPQLKSAEQEIKYDAVAVQQPDGSSIVDIRIPFVFAESLYMQKDLPDELDALRQSINEAANKAMMPDASYLLQIGMPVEMMRDEDRHAKALPDNLSEQEKSLQALAKGPVYIPMRQAGDVLELVLSVQLEPSTGDGVKVRKIDYNEHQLDFMADLLPESSLPSGDEIQLFTPEWLDARQKTIGEGVAKFNAEAAPYIESRESAARALYTERMTAIQEAERAKQDEALAAEKAVYQAAQLYEGIVSTGQVFSGEWKRDSRFGKLSLRVSKAELVENTIHFVGTLYDTDLPEASLDIVGRCDLSTPEEGVSVLVNIYDGQYDPDQATAEVFDAQDGVLRLNLDAKGQLTGVMTCDSWKNLEGKDFTVTMTAPLPEPTAEQEGEDIPDLP